MHHHNVLSFLNIESILEVVAFHEQVASTGFTPDQTMPQMMCEEFYGCDKELNQTKKPKNIKPMKKANDKTKSKSELWSWHVFASFSHAKILI